MFIGYTFVVSTSTIIGEGPNSTVVSAVTKPSAPTGPVLNIGTAAQSSTSVSVSWNPPLITLQNGIILSYVVSWVRLAGLYNDPSKAGTGSQVAFTVLSGLRAGFINGVYQNKNTYTVSGNTLTFSEAPPYTSTIEFVYS